MFYASKTFGFLYYLGDRFLQTMMAISDGNDIANTLILMPSEVPLFAWQLLQS